MTRFWKLELVVAFALLVSGSWLLPYRFPPPLGEVVGASNEVGFNNGVSFAWYLVFLAVPAIILARAYAATLAAGRSPAPDRRVSLVVSVFAAVAALHILAFAALYLYKGRLFFSEAIYFQIIVLRMVAGERPYLDVSFYYGPTMIYPAYWLTKVMSPQAAYFVWYTATYVAGLGVLLVVMRRLLKSDKAAASWFVFLALGFVNPWNGLNVTLVRYLLPSLVLLLVADAVWVGGARRLAVAIAALGFALTYSFDVAAISFAAALVFLVVALMEPWLRPMLDGLQALAGADRRPGGQPEERMAAAAVASRGAIVLVTALAAALAFFLAIDPTGTALRLYPEIALSYASGAHNMPVYPNLPFLTLVAFSIAAAALTLALATGRAAGRSTAIGVAFLALMLVTERGAFGVSEPTHIALYALPAVLLCLFWSVRLERGAVVRRWVASALLVGLLAPVQYFQGKQLWPFVAGVLRLRPMTVAPADGAVAGVRPIEESLTELVHCAGTGRPVLMLNLDYYSQPIYQRQHLRYVGYYPMLITARTPAGIERMIDEVRAAAAVVIARRADLDPFVAPPRSSGVLEVLDLISGGPNEGSRLGAVLLKNQHRLFEPFLEFVRREYRPICDRDGLVAYGPVSH